jgi:hypothetical protein
MKKIILMILSSMTSVSMAADLAVSGRLLDSSNAPIQESGVLIKVKIKVGACIAREEGGMYPQPLQPEEALEDRVLGNQLLIQLLLLIDFYKETMGDFQELKEMETTSTLIVEPVVEPQLMETLQLLETTTDLLTEDLVELILLKRERLNIMRPEETGLENIMQVEDRELVALL